VGGDDVIRALLAAVVLLATFGAGCSKSEPELRAEPRATATPSATGTTDSPPLVLARGVRMVHAAAGSDAAQVIRDASRREAADGRDVVVYVGAKWCEPCQRFHKAAAAGELDTDFPQLTLIEFDLDEDRDRLDRAGYRSAMIPLFVKPNADGTASNKRFEGSVKGDHAVANIAPRLRALLAARSLVVDRA
jgi:thiol-disulfide isomerase/thioredoxin